jgi:hypothetical protein
MTGPAEEGRPPGRYPQDETEAVLLTVQALAGIPGPGWEAVTLVLDGDRLRLRVWVDDADAEREEAQDFADEVDVLVREVGVDLELHEGSPRPYDRSQHGRIVYLRRYTEPREENRP